MAGADDRNERVTITRGKGKNPGRTNVSKRAFEKVYKDLGFTVATDESGASSAPAPAPSETGKKA